MPFVYFIFFKEILGKSQTASCKLFSWLTDIFRIISNDGAESSVKVDLFFFLLSE